MPTLLDQLSGGHPSTIGPAREVARQVLENRELIDEIFDGLAEDHPTIRNRASRVIAEVAAVHTDWIEPYKDEFLDHIMAMDHWIVRANTCKTLAGFSTLTPSERRRVIQWAESLLTDDSSVVKACALDCLVQLSLAPGFSHELKQARHHVEQSAEHGDTPALRARARKMQRLLKRHSANSN